ncbi:NMCC_0638 family (lipo)protein [Marinobacterium sediminicola]|uniref:Uncharacterized protein n=1 Tax=Marinobacterium sediminicola TaxID=518898 RepID=A0ABY1S1I0_9GAMM|nr:hypothetical protein [Marinobacterium sediminicola]ULG69818.1 hypothetical protein LN244_03140 [Marinobacterium sediminicola]SMR75368.1 hypothetical protein SAMN04487964_10930 [Marinobacterium sediminicola]
MKKYTACLLVLMTVLPSLAQADERAVFLKKVYLSFCMKHFDDYGALRHELIAQQLPKLPPQQAQHFLPEGGGDAWPIPYQGQFGQYVLALPEGNRLCSVLARRSDATVTRQWFADLASQAPTPLHSSKLSEKQIQTPLNGEALTESWQWATEHAPRRLLLTLTTSRESGAAIQAMVSLTLSER